MNQIIKKFINPTLKDYNHRFKSWEHCYLAFSNRNESCDTLALHLGFYLASWGMYRGSSGLLWKDYKIHCEAVEIIRNHSDLKFDSFIEIPYVSEILGLVNELKGCYSKITYMKEQEEKYISSTDTLISKVILGSLGCLPAFDRYFNLGFYSKESSIINKKSLSLVFDKTLKMKPEIEKSQNWIFDKTNFWYPVMKVVDMYYWQKGFEKSQSKYLKNQESSS